MKLRVVGAGVGRTGTHSLKLALEQILGAPCYHMIEVFGHPEHIPVWQDAVDGKPVDWDLILGDYAAAVDWPACAFWRQLTDANPDAIVLLSTRSSADAWWKSASDTILEVPRREPPPGSVFDAQMTMAKAMFANTFTQHWRDEVEAKRAYERHNASVRSAVPPPRLVEWQPGDGWAPICDALGMPVPDAPFPHVNTTAEFRTIAGLDDDQP